jgi:hypothetical protein
MSTILVANLPPVNDTGGRFANGVNDTTGKLPPVLATLAKVNFKEKL